MAAQAILGRYQSLSRDELVETLDQAIAALPESSRAPERFEIRTETYPYDNGDHPKLFIEYQRPETDAEEAARETIEFRSPEDHERERA